MRFLFSSLFLFYCLNINAINFVKLNDEISLNTCQEYPNSENYNWSFVLKPDESNLNNEKINLNQCYISFIPDVVGLYQVALNVNNKKELFDYEVLSSLETSKVDIKYISRNNYYNVLMNYYKYSENNNLVFDIDDYSMKKINFGINGTAIIEDLEIGNSVIINTMFDYYFKNDNLYRIKFFPNEYKKFEKIINTRSFNVNDIQYLPITKKINININSFQNKKIIGVTTLYDNDNHNVSKLVSSNIFNDEVNKILFSPIKSINNYPSIIYSGEITETINLQYDDILFSKLNIIVNEEISNSYLTIKIKSLSLNQCLILSQNARCLYQISKNINSNQTITLPNGTYEVSIYQKGYNKTVEVIDVNEDYDFLVDNTPNNEMVNISFPENITSISFTNTQNHNYFFNIEDGVDFVSIPKGIYSITLFTSYGVYNIESINISDNMNIEYKWSKLNITIKKEDKLKYGGIIIINNKNYLFNNGKIHEFYIEK